MKHLFFILFLWIAPAALVLGQVPAQYDEEVRFLLKNQYSVGVYASNAGWAATGKRSLFKNIRVNRFIETDIAFLKHPKEIKNNNGSYSVVLPRGYVYGKLNSVYALRLGVGVERLVFEKGDKNGVEIRWKNSFGPTVALLKPVYLDIIVAPDSPPIVERYDPDRHFNENIFGKAPFFYGIDETKIKVGGYAKTALNFEFGKYDDEYRALEAGVCFDAFLSPIPMMVEIDNPPFFVSFFLAFQFGKRW